MATLEQALRGFAVVVLLVPLGTARSDDILDELTRNQKKDEKKADPDEDDGRARLRFHRLRHADPKWDKNFTNDQCNLLRELVVRYPKMQGKVARETTPIDYTTLAAFKADSPPAILYIGGSSFKPSAAEKRILAKYVVQGHGMILGDSFDRVFGDDFTAVMNEITGARPQEIPRDAAFQTLPFEIKQTPFLMAHNGTKPMGWSVEKRWAVYLHPGELSALWRDDRGGAKKEVAEEGIRLGLNLHIYALKEQHKWRLSNKP